MDFVGGVQWERGGARAGEGVDVAEGIFRGGAGHDGIGVSGDLRGVILKPGFEAKPGRIGGGVGEDVV